MSLRPHDIAHLFHELVDAGYRLDARQLAAAQKIALSPWPSDGASGPARLKTLLAPIFAKSTGEQAEFYQRFERWIEAKQPVAPTDERAIRPTSPPGPDRIAPPNQARKIVRDVRRWPNLAVAALVPVLLAFAVFAWQKLSVPAALQVLLDKAPATDSPSTTGAEDPAVNERDPDARTEVLRPPDNNLPLPFKTFLATIPLTMLGGWSYLRWRRRSLWLERRRTRGAADIGRLRIRSSFDHLFASPDFQLSAQDLRRHRQIALADLDLDRTAAATAERAGLFEPVYQFRPQTPEYLFLIEETGANDHVARLFDEVVGRLKAEGVFVDRYYFSKDPRLVYRDDKARTAVTIHELAAIAHDHRLIVVGNAEGFFHPVTGESQPWLEGFDSWPSRVLMSTRLHPLDQWSLQEIELLEQGFSIATATPRGMRAVSHRLSHGEEVAEAQVLDGIEPATPQKRMVRPKRADFAGRERDRITERVFPSRRRQLPADLVDFAGRERETAELEALLSGDGAAAAITAIGGMGGIGKSALAIHVAHRLVERYPDGQLVVDMGGTSDAPLEPAVAMERVIHSFEPAARLPDEPDAVAALYRSLLSGKRALIILDNASDGAQVRPLMPPPPCAAIVTSRRGIALDGVRSFNLDALSESEARGLLVAILDPDRVGEAELAELADACGRLPLALRVAGAFLNLHRDWRADEYLAALGDERERMTRLRIEGDVALDVVASLGLSVAQLARAQADLAARWRMLGVFAGDFERAAAAAVWDAPSAEARDGLSALVGRSMVLFDEDAGRYRLHDLMRDVARGADLEKADLAALAPIEQQAAARHAEHYLGVLGSADELYLRGDDGITAGLALFDLERRNIEAGQDWAARTSPGDDAAARACGRYPDAGAYVLNLRLHARDRIGWLEASVGAARRLQDRAMEGAALGNLGLGYADLGETRRAIEFHEQYLEIAREIGDRRGEGTALGNLGLAYAALGETRRAIEFYEQVMEIFREIGDRRGEGNALGNLGSAYAALGETRRAIEFHEQYLEIAREIGDRRGEGAALGNLGLAYAALGETRRAIEFHEQALKVSRDIGDRRAEGQDLGNLGNAYAALGETRRAIEFHEQSLEIAHAIGDRRGEGAVLGCLGNDYATLGETRRAIEFHEQYLEIAREIDDRRGEGICLYNLGNELAKAGERGQAITRLQEALKIFEEIEAPFADQARAALARLKSDD